MTVTYVVTTDIGKVRLLTGDKVISDPAFTDEEIQVFLTQQGNVNLAAAALLEAWAASYAANADSEKIGDYSYTQKTTANMLELAKHLREAEASQPCGDWSEMDLVNYGESV